MKRKPHPLQRVGWGKVVRKPFQSLAHEDTTSVGWVTTEEGEQQVQGWEAEAFDFWAAAWASAGEYFEGSIVTERLPLRIHNR